MTQAMSDEWLNRWHKHKWKADLQEDFHSKNFFIEITLDSVYEHRVIIHLNDFVKVFLLRRGRQFAWQQHTEEDVLLLIAFPWWQREIYIHGGLNRFWSRVIERRKAVGAEQQFNRRNSLNFWLFPKGAVVDICDMHVFVCGLCNVTCNNIHTSTSMSCNNIRILTSTNNATCNNAVRGYGSRAFVLNGGVVGMRRHQCLQTFFEWKMKHFLVRTPLQKQRFNSYSGHCNESNSNCKEEKKNQHHKEKKTLESKRLPSQPATGHVTPRFLSSQICLWHFMHPWYVRTSTPA